MCAFRSHQDVYLALDPVFDLAHQLLGRVTGAGYGFADHHRHLARAFEEGVARPQQSGVVRDRQHARPRLHCDICPAELVLAAFSDGDARTAGDDFPARTARQPRHAHHHHPIGHVDDDQQKVVDERAQEHHAASARAAAARSRWVSVPSGRPPDLSVCSPLPVSTRTGRAPAALAASRSRSESPIAGTPASETLKRSAISCSMPGLGLRHAQPASWACAQKNTASMRPPSWFTALCILSCMALSVAISNKPRPRPDWLVATTTRKPAWVKRAIASRLPAMGFHSSGLLMY